MSRWRAKQCAGCPWRKAVDPTKDIPNGYCAVKHEGLRDTIATPGSLNGLSGPLRVMACHETHETACVGWAVNQIGPGNNIALRLAVSRDPTVPEFKLRGAQHETFDDTIPKEQT